MKVRNLPTAVIPSAVVFLFSIVIATATPIVAATPNLQSITPCGGQRGTELTVTFRGVRLADTQEVILYRPGISASKIEVTDDKKNVVRATFAIASDCPLGLHGVRLRTATGLSNLLTFSVGTLPEIEETEPNNEFSQPQEIPLGTTVNGVVRNEDVDFFAVTAKQGERITAEIEGLRLGRSFFDPFVAILNEDRFVLASADDTPLAHQDAVCSIVAPTDGRYIVEVRECAYGGSDSAVYRLHVGRFPRPRAVFPAGGRAGESVELRWLGDVVGEWTTTVKLPDTPQPDFALFAEDPQGISPGPYPFRVSELPNAIETEPNATADQATAVTAPAALNGILAESGDIDLYKFSAKKDEVYDIRVYARSLRSPVDSVLTIRRAKGGNVANNDDSGMPDSYVRFRAPADDEYVLSICDHLNRGGPEFVYRVELAPVAPRLTMQLPERVTFVDVTAPVPRANRFALLIGAKREDFGGPVDVQLEGLPPGVTADIVSIADGQTVVPVVFSSAADAALGSSLIDVIGRNTTDNRTIEGHLWQRTSLVRGQNNREIWQYEADRMATAVTEAVPFTLDVVQPKSPLSRNGSKELKVVATRAEGFTAAIKLEMLYNPPGVSASGSVSIGEGKAEAVMPLTANNSAQLGNWRIVITGEAPVKDGPIQVATPVRTLEVVEPFFRFTFPAVSLEQGQKGALALGIEKTRDFTGKATLELAGLPPNVTSEPREIGPEATETIFPIVTTEKSPPGRHKSVVCRAVVTVEGEPVVQLLGTGEVQIRRPPPPKATDKAETPTEKPKPQQAAPQRLSRLEQLRLQQKQNTDKK